jgi:hypothetical protein
MYLLSVGIQDDPSYYLAGFAQRETAEAVLAFLEEEAAKDNTFYIMYDGVVVNVHDLQIDYIPEFEHAKVGKSEPIQAKTLQELLDESAALFEDGD